VAADADVVTIGEGGAGTERLLLYLHAVGRPQIANHETASGIDDYGVVSADVVGVQDDVVVWEAPYPGDRRLERIAPFCAA